MHIVVKLPTVSAHKLMPRDEILTSLRPGPSPGRPCLRRPTSIPPTFLTTHSLGTNSHPTYYSKSHLIYGTTDMRCSALPACAATGVESLSNAPLIGLKYPPNALQSCSNSGYNGPETCPLTQKSVIFLQNCTVVFTCLRIRPTDISRNAGYLS